jgi:hypothetical protein
MNASTQTAFPVLQTERSDILDAFFNTLICIAQRIKH